MSEVERAQALKQVQLELFQLKKDYLLKRKELKRQLVLIQGRGMKECRRCREMMDVEQFYRSNAYTDGRDVYCRECRGAMDKARYQKRKGNVRAA